MFIAASSLTRYLKTYGSATRSTKRPLSHSLHITVPVDAPAVMVERTPVASEAAWGRWTVQKRRPQFEQTSMT